MAKRNQAARIRETKSAVSRLPLTLFELPVAIRCSDIFEAAYEQALEEGKSDERARELARTYYRGAMPAPIDIESTRDFIACVTLGVLVGVFPLKEATALYYGAQVALSVNRSAAGRTKTA
jgi:hypothetical protein